MLEGKGVGVRNDSAIATLLHHGYGRAPSQCGSGAPPGCALTAPGGTCLPHRYYRPPHRCAARRGDSYLVQHTLGVYLYEIRHKHARSLGFPPRRRRSIHHCEYWNSSTHAHHTLFHCSLHHFRHIVPGRFKGSDL